jgi:hypothetical protein
VWLFPNHYAASRAASVGSKGLGFGGPKPSPSAAAEGQDFGSPDTLSRRAVVTAIPLNIDPESSDWETWIPKNKGRWRGGIYWTLTQHLQESRLRLERQHG